MGMGGCGIGSDQMDGFVFCFGVEEMDSSSGLPKLS